MDVAIVQELSEKLVRFLETGDVPEGLFRPDVFLDLTMLTWRVAEGTIAEVTVYCTGDWDQARQAEHAAAVTLIRA